MRNDNFKYTYEFAGLSDIGKKRKNNEDRLILHPDQDFFAVSDGMGGLRCGETAAIYVSESLPGMIDLCAKECAGKPEPETAAKQVQTAVQMLSDALYRKGNSPRRFDYGATIAGVWLYGDKAVFVDLGDSRGYLFPASTEALIQVTQDMNVAGMLVRLGQMTKEEARNSPAGSRLTAFVGMEEPATPETFIETVHPGDVILLCSDGLFGVTPETEIIEILQSGKTPEEICKALIDAANSHGGRDNISVIYIKIM